MSLSINIGRPFLNDKTLDEQARSVLRLYGTDAHVYLPGANGVAIGGLNSGNYVESTFSTLASVDSVVGGARDPVGSIDATQATTANKPALRRGLYNLLLNSATPATQSVTCAATPYTLALYGTGSVTLSGTGSGTLNGTGASDLVVLNFTPTAGSVTFTKSGTVSSFGLFAGTLTAQQILAEGGIPLTTSTAASNPSAGRYSWQFDGTNDSLALGSVPFQMSDDHCVIAGFRPDAGDVFVVGITNAGDTTMCGNLRLASDGHLSAWWKDDVAAQSIIYGPSSVIGATLVASAQKVGNVKSLRSNGTQVATDSTVLGTTTLTNANIGSLASVGGFMNGATGPVILIKGTISDSDLLTLERWVASQMPNGPQF